MANPKTKKKMDKKTYTYEEYLKNLRPKSLDRLKDVSHGPTTSRSQPEPLPHDGDITNDAEPSRRPQ